MEKSENLFDDQKWMLNSGSDFGFCAVFRLVNFRQRLMSRASFIRHILGFRSGFPDRFFLTLISAVTPYLCFIAVKKTSDRLAIMHIGRRNID